MQLQRPADLEAAVVGPTTLPVLLVQAVQEHNLAAAVVGQVLLKDSQTPGLLAVTAAMAE